MADNTLMDAETMASGQALENESNAMGLDVPAVPDLLKAPSFPQDDPFTTPVGGRTLTDAGLTPENFKPVSHDVFREYLINAVTPDLVTALGVPAEQALRAKELGKRMGLSAGVVSQDLKRYEREFALQSKRLALQDNDTLLAFMADPEKVPFVADDMDALGYVSSVARGFGEGVTKTSEQTTQDLQDFVALMSGREPSEGNVDWQEGSNWLYRGSRFVGGLGTSIGRSVAEGGIAGAALGAGVGSVVPAVGTVVGAGAGATTGIAAHQAGQGAGSIGRTVFWGLVKDGVPRDVAFERAKEAMSDQFVKEFGLNAVQVGFVFNNIMKPFANQLSNGLVREVAKTALVSGAENATLEVLSEGSTIALEERARMQAGLPSMYDGMSPEQVSEVAGRLGESALAGLAGGALFGSGGHVLGHALSRHLREAPVALSDEQSLSNLIDAGIETKTLLRDPETFKEYAQLELEGTGKETSFISLEVFEQQQQANPDLWAKIVPDIDQQLGLARETGADISFPTANLISYMQADAKALLPEVKTTPDGMTPNEARQTSVEVDAETRAKFDEVIAKITKRGEGQEGFDPNAISDFDIIKQDVLDRLSVSDVSLKEKRAVAELVAQRYVGLEKQTGGQVGTALQLYEKDPYVIQRSTVEGSDADVMAAVEAYRNPVPTVQKTESGKVAIVDVPKARAESVQPVSVGGDVAPLAFEGQAIGTGSVRVGSEEIPTQVMVVDAGMLSPTLGKAENQARDRSRVASELQIEGYANNLDPRYLTPDYPDMLNGSPTVTRDGQIIGGNGRAEAIKRAYARGKGEAYRAMVAQRAGEAGLDVSGMTAPVLVRVLDKNVDVRKAAILSNEGGSASQSALEQAGADASRLPPLDAFVFTEEGRLAKTGNETVLRQFMGELPIEEQGRFVDAEGALSAEGERRINNAILYTAFGDSPVLSAMIDDISPEGRNLLNALAKTAPKIASVEEGIGRGVLYPVSLRDDLLAGAWKFLDLKRQGLSVPDYLSQGDIFGDGVSPEAKEFMRIIDQNNRSSKRLTEKLTEAYDRIEKAGNPAQTDIFGGGGITKGDALRGLVEAPTPEPIKQIEERLAVEEPAPVVAEKPTKASKKKKAVKKEATREPAVERPLNQEVFNASVEKWKTVVSEDYAQKLAFLDEAFISNMAEGLGMKPEDFQRLYGVKVIDETWLDGPGGGVFKPKGRRGDREYNINYRLKSQGTKQFTMLAHESAHYYLQVLLDINQSIKDGTVTDVAMSPKLEKTINDLRDYFVENYDTLIQKQGEKSKQGTQYESAGHLRQIGKKGGREFFRRIFDEGLLSAPITYTGAKGRIEAEAKFSAISIMHEAFAEGFEVYLSTGKAPTPRLKEIFKTVATWVRDTWASMSGLKVMSRLQETNVEADREFAYTPALHKIFDDLLTTQRERGGDTYNSALGRIAFAEDVAIIQLFQKANVSTLIHEFGHKWMRELFIMAEGASKYNPAFDEVRADHEATKTWFKNNAEDLLGRHKRDAKRRKKTGGEERAIIESIEQKGGVDYIKKVIDDGFKDETPEGLYVDMMMNEAWARAFEAYTRDGKAPVPELRNAFKRFREALLRIYQTLVGLNVPMDKSINEVFDRMLGAETVVKEKASEFKLESLFPTLEESGMGKGEYEAYIKKIDAHKERAIQKVMKENMRAIVEREKADNIPAVNALRERFTAEARATKAVQTAYKMLGYDPEQGVFTSAAMLLDPEDAVRRFGEDFVKGIPEDLMRASDGYPIEFLVERLGYGKQADFMADMGALKEIQNRNGRQKITKAIDSATEKQVNKAFAERYDPKDLEQEAMDALYNGDSNPLRAIELNVLGRRIGEKDISPEAMEAYARDKVLTFGANELAKSPKQYLNAARRAGNRVQKALMKGDYVEAWKAKREQALAELVYKHARDFQLFTRRAENFYGKIGKNPEIKDVSFDHANILHRMLQQFGYRSARDLKASRVGLDMPTPYKEDVMRPLANVIRDFLGDRTKEEYSSREEIVFPDEIFDKIIREDKNLNVEEYTQLYQVMRSIYTNGKNEGKIFADGKVQDFTEARDNVILALDARGRKKAKKKAYASPASRTSGEEWAESYGSFVESIGSSTQSFENILNVIGSPELLQINTDFQNGKYEHARWVNGLQDVFKIEMKNRLGKDYKAWAVSLNDFVKNDKLFDAESEKFVTMKRVDLFTLAWNMGNADNLTKLVQTWGWDEAVLREFVKDNMRAEDWQYVQAVAKHVEKLWPQMKALEERLHGYAPPKVIPTPIETKEGMIEGWYWPIKYEDTLGEPVDDIAHGGTRGTIKTSGATIARQNNTGGKRVSLNSVNTIAGIQKNSYRNSVLEPLVQLDKLLKDRKLAKAIQENLGEKHYEHMREWLKDQLDPARRNTFSNDFIVPIRSWFQKGVVLGQFGFALKSVLDSTAEPLRAWAHKAIGIKAYTGAMLEFVHSPMRLANWAKEIDAIDSHGAFESLLHAIGRKDLATRTELSSPVSREAVDLLLQQGENKTGFRRFRKGVGEFAFNLMEWFGHYGKIFAARAAYNRFLKENPTALHRDAIDHANKVIRDNFVQKNVADKPLILRTGTDPDRKQYMRFNSKIFEQIYREWDELFTNKEGEKTLDMLSRKSGAAVRGLAHIAIPTFMYYYLTNKMGLWDEEDDTTEEKALKRTVLIMGGGVFGSLPIMRDVWDALSDPAPYAGSGAGVAFSPLVNVAKSANRMVRKGEVSQKDADAFIGLMGASMQLPLSKPARLGEWMYGVNTGDIQYDENTTFPDIVQDIGAGKQVSNR